MKCKNCDSNDMFSNGDLIIGKDRDNEDFEEFLNLELWTCNECHSTFTYDKEAT